MNYSHSHDAAQIQPLRDGPAMKRKTTPISSLNSDCCIAHGFQLRPAHTGDKLGGAAKFAAQQTKHTGDGTLRQQNNLSHKVI